MDFTTLPSKIEHDIVEMQDSEHEESFCIAPNSCTVRRKERRKTVHLFISDPLGCRGRRGLGLCRALVRRLAPPQPAPTVHPLRDPMPILPCPVHFPPCQRVPEELKLTIFTETKRDKKLSHTYPTVCIPRDSKQDLQEHKLI